MTNGRGDSYTPAMKLAQPVPILRMFDETVAKEFYVGFLGFKVDWEHRRKWGQTPNPSKWGLTPFTA